MTWALFGAVFGVFFMLGRRRNRKRGETLMGAGSVRSENRGGF